MDTKLTLRTGNVRHLKFSFANEKDTDTAIAKVTFEIIDPTNVQIAELAQLARTTSDLDLELSAAQIPLPLRM